jgi:hypothetical protein
MSPADYRKLRHSLRSLQYFLALIENAVFVDRGVFVSIQDEFNLLRADFPELTPGINHEDFKFDDKRYLADGLRAYLTRVIGRVQVLIEEQAETPVPQQREFGFVGNAELRRIIERDFAEAQRAFIARCWKSSIVLAGGMIEAILSDLLLANQDLVSRATKAPKNPDITRWDLTDLIKVAVELNLVSAGVEKLSHPIREFRNLIHPGNEIRNGLQFDAEEAKIALEVLNIVYRGLSKAGQGFTNREASPSFPPH